jgi:hypothetical protein
MPVFILRESPPRLSTGSGDIPEHWLRRDRYHLSSVSGENAAGLHLKPRTLSVGEVL